MGRFDIATNKIPDRSSPNSGNKVIREIPPARPINSYRDSDEVPELSQAGHSRFFMFQAPSGIRIVVPTDKAGFSMQRGPNGTLEIRGLSPSTLASIFKEVEQPQQQSAGRYEILGLLGIGSNEDSEE